MNFGLLHSRLGAVSPDQLRRLLEGGAAATNGALKSALDGSLRVTFVSMFVVGLLVAVTAALAPQVKFAARAPAE